jgi:hypothetical protein
MCLSICRSLNRKSSSLDILKVIGEASWRKKASERQSHLRDEGGRARIAMQVL